MTHRRVVIIIVFSFVFFSACKEEKEAVQYGDIQGEWELIRAERNGRITTTFEKSHFNFTDDTILSTNIPYLQTIGKVRLEESQLLTEGNKIENASVQLIDSTGNLLFKTDIKDYKFEFLLKRQ